MGDFVGFRSCVTDEIDLNICGNNLPFFRQYETFPKRKFSEKKLWKKLLWCLQLGKKPFLNLMGIPCGIFGAVDSIKIAYSKNTFLFRTLSGALTLALTGLFGYNFFHKIENFPEISEMFLKHSFAKRTLRTKEQLTLVRFIAWESNKRAKDLE